MSMGNKSKQHKSAKDLAFERERIRLQSTIRQKDDEIFRLKAEINKYKMEAESWKETATILEGYIGIPKEDILKNIELGKKIEGFLNPIETISKLL